MVGIVGMVGMEVGWLAGGVSLGGPERYTVLLPVVAAAPALGLFVRTVTHGRYVSCCSMFPPVVKTGKKRSELN